MTENRLLAALPTEDRGRLRPKFEVVPFEKGRALHDIGELIRYVYFPATGFCSLVALTPDGAMLELAAIGNEGVIGLSVVLQSPTAPCLVLGQVSGTAYRIRAEVLAAEFQRGSALQAILLQYTSRLLSEISQGIVCHHFHSVLQRVCRWLLGAAERLQSDTLDLTQEAIAHALGITRTGVTKVAVRLQDAHAISCRHGHIVILRRAYLADTACECHGLMREATSPAPEAHKVMAAMTLPPRTTRARSVA
jgi:CRP-like cAMP-binding protein